MEFIYGNRNKVVNNEILEDISDMYNIPEEFNSSSENKTGIWINIENVNIDNTSKRLNESIYGNFR